MGGELQRKPEWVWMKFCLLVEEAPRPLLCDCNFEPGRVPAKSSFIAQRSVALTCQILHSPSEVVGCTGGAVARPGAAIDSSCPSPLGCGARQRSSYQYVCGMLEMSKVWRQS